MAAAGPAKEGNWAGMAKILLAEDDDSLRLFLAKALQRAGHDVVDKADGLTAMEAVENGEFDLLLADIVMPGMDGMQFLRKLKSVDSTLPVIMITGHGDVPMAVEAMRLGAFDFLEKPFNPDRMTELAKRASNARRLVLDNRALRRELSDGSALMNKLIVSDH